MNGSSQASRSEVPNRILDLLTGVLRGESPEWPSGMTSGDVLRVAEDHGVLELVAACEAALTSWPADLRTSLRTSLRNACVMEAVRQRELVRVTNALHEAGIDPLLVKGTALAYWLYDAAHLRPRMDTDLLVAEGDVSTATALLEQLGYTRTAQNVGRLVSHQVALGRIDSHGVWHAVDIHWKIANPHVFANRLALPELMSSAIAVPGLGVAARTPAPILALLIGAVHMAAHHTRHLRLIWLYDLHLLCRRIRADEFDELVSLATSRGLAAVCAQGLHLSQRWLKTPVPEHVLSALDAVDAASEESARFVGRSVGKLGTLVSDLQTLPTFGARVRLLYEHAFPPADFMLRSYRTSHRTWLPALYLHRMITGGWRWIRQA